MPAVTADAAAAPGGAVPLKRGKKKLMILVGAALALVLAAGGGGVWVLKKRAAQAAALAAGEEEATGSEAVAHATGVKHEAKGMPVYLPLDPFVINLAGFWLCGFPVSVMLAFGTPLRAMGLWWGLAAGLAVVAALLLLRVRSRLRGALVRVEHVVGAQASPETSGI